MKTIVVVDARLIMYQTFHKHTNIITSINIIHSYLSKYIKRYDKLIFAWDNKYGSRRRKELYPAYKAHRREKIKTDKEVKRLKEFNKEYDKMKDIFDMIGNVIDIDGYEADDIANLIVERFRGKTKIYLLSSDYDWASNIIDDNIYQIHLTKGLININNCVNIYGIHPDNILFAQSIIGSVKENVKGVVKLGEKRIKNLLLNNSQKETFNIIKDWINTKKYGISLPKEFETLDKLLEFNYNIFRKITIEDLTKKEVKCLQEQFGHQLKYCREDIEMAIFKKLNTPFLFSEEEQKFFKLK